MQKKSVLSLCIAVALSGNSYAETAQLEKKRPTNSCPTNISVLTEAQKAKLPAECLKQPSFLEEQWGWVAGGVAAVAAAVGIAVANDGGDDNGDSGYTPPTPPTPPDDGGDTPTPPDDGGDTPTPPDDGGDTPTPPAPRSFANGVIWDEAASTLTITPKDSGTTTTWSYTDNGDGTYTLVDKDDSSKTAQLDTWNINGTGDDQTVTLSGLSGDGSFAWIYDSEGNIRNVDPDKMHAGDGQTNVIPGTDTSGKGQTGQIISGDDTKNTIDGGSKASDGGTGTLIDGDGTSTTISGGSSADGEGATGTKIDGNGNTLNTDGETKGTGGGTGADITGNGNTIINTDGSAAEGSGSTGTRVDGNGNTIDNTGGSSATAGGTGTSVGGDGNEVNNAGSSTVDGSGSTGTEVSGNNNTINNTGDIVVTHAATGINVSGDTNAVSNDGNITVRDSGSTGILISGDDASFTNSGSIDSTLSGTGVKVSGDNAVLALDGDISVSAVKDADGVLEGATGIDVSGNAAQITLTGGMSVAIDREDASQQEGSVRGLQVSGDDNRIIMDGSLNISQQSTASINPNFDPVQGINVAGDGNEVTVTGGINVTALIKPDDTSLVSFNVTGVAIDGASTVTVSGQSSVDIAGGTIGAGVQFASVSGGGKLEMAVDSVLNITSSDIIVGYFDDYSVLGASGAGSEINNAGMINFDGSTAMRVEDGATLNNSGTINFVADSHFDRSEAMLVNGENSQAMNSGTISLTSAQVPDEGMSGINYYPLAWTTDTAYAMLSGNAGGSEIINDSEGIINLNGSGVYGMAVVKGSGTNNGEINVNGSYYSDGSKGMSTGMMVGSTNNAGDGTVTNNGTITVNNMGIGMSALAGGTAINSGVINLEADAGTTAQGDDQLIGMAAYDGGVVINDTTGVININADYGQAFYSEGNGIIINKGSINLDGSTMDPADPHMGSKPTDKTLLDSAYGSMSDTTLDDAEGFIMPAAVANYGKLTLTGGDLQVSGSLYNRAGATLNADLSMGSNTTFFNDGQFTGKANMASYSTSVVNTGTMTASADGDAVIDGSFQYFNQAGGTITNGSAQAATGGVNYLINNTRTTNNSGNGVNSGKIIATNGYGAINLANTGTGAANQIYQNTATGEISGSGLTDKVLIQLGKGYGFANSGTITLENSTNAVAIQTANTSYEQKVINAGTINLGSADASDTSSGLIAMKGSNAGNTTLNNTATGVINIYADNSYAFGGSYTKVINNGQVNLACGNSTCGIFAPGASNTNENTGAADLSIPAAATAPSQGSVPADPDAVQNISGYQVGTNANGTAGTLTASRMMLQDVSVDTSFTSGTAATTETFNDVFVGEDIQGVENIKSTSVVWTATGEKDAQGNVDVTMSKNAYTDVVNDSGVSSVAAALDAGYTNNELYNSLNLKTSAELDSALKQISGSKATGVSRDARILSNRFDMLADAAPVMNNGLAFNVVAKGDQRAELSNDTTYDMLALRQSLAFGGNQTLSMEYGIARLDGNGNAMSAGDNGVTGGYSQFFGLKHSLPLSDDGLSWDNALRYDVHNFDSNRAVRYGDVNKTANADTRQQYMEFRTEGSKAFKVQEALTVTPFAGLKMRHTMEDGYSEKGAGDFNLNMSSSSETAVDAVVGLKLSYAGEDGWAATASLEGGPNLSYAKSNRTASLAGARGQTFSVQDDQQGGGVNGQAMAGVKYSSGDAHFTADAYHWQEDGVKDKGFMVNYKHTF